MGAGLRTLLRTWKDDFDTKVQREDDSGLRLQVGLLRARPRSAQDTAISDDDDKLSRARYELLPVFGVGWLPLLGGV